MFLKKWNESRASKTLLPPRNFNSLHRGLSHHKCNKKISPHKILRNFQIKCPNITGGGTMETLCYIIYLIDLSNKLYDTEKSLISFYVMFIKKFYNQTCWIKFNLITFILTCGWLHSIILKKINFIRKLSNLVNLWQSLYEKGKDE